MFTSWMSIAVTFISNVYIETGLIGIFFIMLLENCYVPLPASEVLLAIAGVLITRGTFLPDLPLWERIALVSVASSSGCLIGSTIIYAIGRTGGRQLLLKYGHYVLISQHDMKRADQFFLRRGSATIFYSRLLPVVRTWVSLPAGVTNAPFMKFCLFTWCGSLLWCSVFTYLGVILNSHFDQYKPIFSDLGACAIGIYAVLIILYVWRHIHHRAVLSEMCEQEI